MSGLTTKKATLAQRIKNALVHQGWKAEITRERVSWTVTTDAPVETLQRIESRERL